MDKKVTFIFNEGRISRLMNKDKYPKDFFYSYHLFKNEFDDVGIIELNSKTNGIIFLIFKFIRKISNIPIFSEGLMKYTKIKDIFNSDTLIATNQNIAFSLLPIILLKKIFRKTDLVFFVMGLVDNSKDIQINKLIINSLLKNTKSLIFLSKKELNQAFKLFPKYNEKFLYIPFCIDTEYWSKKEITINEKKVLFIGNDKNRDYDFAIELAEKMKDYEFTFVTDKIKDPNLENLTFLNGNWREEIVSDSSIKNLYKENFLTIVPLIKNHQPSGQSVTLQSISTGTPVLITMTEGFWDEKLFKNDENIFVLSGNDLEKWEEKIENIYNNRVLYNKVQSEGADLVRGKLNLNYLYSELKNLIFKVSF
ncbi:MAG: hypothetical protein CBD76_00425 [Pelagibacteraceae bacterium TMED216]|nr:MAG: hypothetical protein CBD76_00425 [Pelagibacteraceae bacterium TMED216]|tara:strand:+ start:693 stop:1787 length:1095 start_codon:yes stop_codon:yes gene_type:complete